MSATRPLFRGNPDIGPTVLPRAEFDPEADLGDVSLIGRGGRFIRTTLGIESGPYQAIGPIDDQGLVADHVETL